MKQVRRKHMHPPRTIVAGPISTSTWHLSLQPTKDAAVKANRITWHCCSTNPPSIYIVQDLRSFTFHIKRILLINLIIVTMTYTHKHIVFNDSDLTFRSYTESRTVSTKRLTIFYRPNCAHSPRQTPLLLPGPREPTMHIQLQPPLITPFIFTKKKSDHSLTILN